MGAGYRALHCGFLGILSNDIRNPATGDIENPATPVMLIPRPEPLRRWI
jgi:hypothetical protein